MKVHQNEWEVSLAGNTLLVRLDMERAHAAWSQWQVDRHSNAEYEIHLVLQGTGQIDIIDRLHTLTRGQAILIPPNQHHNSCSLPGEFLRFSIPFFVPSFSFSQMLQQRFPEACEFNVTPEIERLCRKIIDGHANRPAFWRNLYPLLLSELIIALFQLLCPDLDREHGGSINGGRHRNPDYAGIISGYLERHYMEKVKLDELSALLKLSRRQIHRVVLENYGMNFQQLLLTTRMDRATWLLRTTDMPMGELIGSVGYTSEVAFYQAFRKHFHMSPLQYRKQLALPPESEGAAVLDAMGEDK